MLLSFCCMRLDLASNMSPSRNTLEQSTDLFRRVHNLSKHKHHNNRPNQDDNPAPGYYNLHYYTIRSNNGSGNPNHHLGQLAVSVDNLYNYIGTAYDIDFADNYYRSIDHN